MKLGYGSCDPMDNYFQKQHHKRYIRGSRSWLKDKYLEGGLESQKEMRNRHINNLQHAQIAKANQRKNEIESANSKIFLRLQSAASCIPRFDPGATKTLSLAQMAFKSKDPPTIQSVRVERKGTLNLD